MVSTLPPQRPPKGLTFQERNILSQAAKRAAITGKLDLGQFPGASAMFVSDVQEHSLRFFEQITALDAIGRECPAVELAANSPSPIGILKSVPPSVQTIMGTI